MARRARRCPSTFATTVLAVAIWGMAGAFAPARVGAVLPQTTAHRAWGALGSEPRGTVQRAADRVLARRVRGAIRADAFLAQAAPVVEVTSNRGIVRLVGRVRTDKERSSIAFKAEQIALVGGVDNRVTVGAGVDPVAPQRGGDSMTAATLVSILLVLLGAAARVYQGFPYTTREKILNLGATRETQETIAVPPDGTVLIGLEAKRS